MESVAAGGCCCCVCATVIFLIVMISTSLKQVDQTEWALKYNFWSESIDPEPIVQPGMRWVGMGNYLLRFPNTNKNVFFRPLTHGKGSGGEGDLWQPPISVRTMDGLIVDLQMEFTYRLDMAKLRDLYMLVGKGPEHDSSMENGWHANLVNLAIGVIDNWSTKFVAREFIVNRTMVNMKFEEQLKPALKNFHIDLQTLQLQDVEFPLAKEYEQSILDTTSWLRKVSLAKQEKITTEIQQQTKWKMAQELANKTIIDAQGQAQQTMLNNQAEVAQYIYRQKKDAAGYQQQLKFFQDRGSSEPVSDFLNYMQTRAFKVHQDGQTVVKLSAAGVR